jgi:FixJ family two-component response regulator
MGVTDQTICSSRHAKGQTSKMIAIIDDDESMQDSLQDLIESTGLVARCLDQRKNSLNPICILGLRA